MRSAVLLLWRARMRGSLRRVVALALLTALGGGISLAVAAGARRTADAHDEVLALSNTGEFGSSYAVDQADGPDAINELIETIPAVGDFSQRVGFQVLLPETPVAALSSFAYYNDPVVVERPVLLEGRLPDAADEVFLNEASAAAAGASVGEQLEVVIADAEYTEFDPETLEVVGIGLLPDEVYEDETGAKPTLVYAKDFVDSHRELIAWGAAIVSVAPGAARADAIGQLVERGITIDDDRVADREQARAAIRPLVVTLWALAVLAGLATIAVVGQALRRLVRRSPADARSLAATGCSPTMLLAADIGVAVAVGIAGAVGAVGAAILASPLFPQGRARRIPDLRGLDVDVAILGLGAAALLVALIAVVAATALRRTQHQAPRAGVAPGVLGTNPAVSTGVRFATGRRGLVGTVGGVALGLIMIVAAVVFTGSMQRLVSHPELAGFNWDLVGRDSYAVIDTEAIGEQLGDDADVERITGLSFVDVAVDGDPLPASVWAAIQGSPWPSLVSGRAPSGPNEILLGPATLDDLGYELGDSVTVGFAAGLDPQADVTEVDMTVVGTAVSPPISLAGSDTPRLDEGVLVQYDDVPTLESLYGSAVLFDVAAGDADAVQAQFPEGLPDDVDAATEWFETAEPAEVIQAADSIDVLVLVIVALLIGVMATVAHNLLGFVRERRRAFAVLAALGFTPRQVRSTVLWQSALVVGAALVVAVPLGIAAGRWLYRGFAGGIGVIVESAVPLLALSGAVLGAIVLVQGIALVPARRARNTNPAAELRSE